VLARCHGLTPAFPEPAMLSVEKNAPSGPQASLL
jgi:hypothetical protein